MQYENLWMKDYLAELGACPKSDPDHASRHNIAAKLIRKVWDIVQIKLRANK